MKRREFLSLSAVTALALLTGCGGSNSSTTGGGPGNGPGNGSGNGNPSLPPANEKLLPIPPALHGNVFDLTVQPAQHEFFAGISTSTFAVNGSYLGPTLFLRNGSTVSINYTNTLNEIISMHGHGMHLPAVMDGTPHQEFSSGDTWTARYTVKQKACTNWYHPHTLDRTAVQVYKGIAGMIIVEDDESDALDLPKRYGADDIPLVLQDRVFDGNGQIVYAPSRMQIMQGYVGDTFIVNGAIEPTFNAEAKEIRFRILNGSNSSVYELGFSDGRNFKQIATDNAFLEAPVTMNRLLLSPAERAEIVVDFTGEKGQTLTLKEYRHNKTFLHIDVNKDAGSITTLPSALTALEHLDPSSAVRTRTFTLEGRMGSFSINGRSMDMNRIDERVPLNDVEIWEVTNTMGIDHNFHIHATHFMLLERNGSTNIAANEKGYKDTIFIPGGENVKLIVKMTDYTDAVVPYMYHCHFLEHEDNGMMGQFTVS